MTAPYPLGGRYELGNALRTGHLTHTYEGLDRRDQRPVAIDVLHRAHADDQAVSNRFRAAGTTASLLIHPCIAEVLAVGEADGLGYIVTELLRGPTLEEVLRADGRLAVTPAGTVALHVADALAYAHERGVVHGGLTPADIHLTAGGAKVSGFGLAGVTSLTPGNPRYGLPEQGSGHYADPRADLYALGCCLYEMIMGRPPFVGDPQMVERLVARAPAELGPVLRRLLAVDPAQRYQRSDAAAADLRAALGRPEPEPRPDPGTAPDGADRAHTPRGSGAYGGRASPVVPAHRKVSPEPSEDAMSDLARRLLTRTAVPAAVVLLLVGTLAVTTGHIGFGPGFVVRGGGSPSADAGTRPEASSSGDPSGTAAPTTAAGQDEDSTSTTETTTPSETTTTTESPEDEEETDEEGDEDGDGEDDGDRDPGTTVPTTTSVPPSTTPTTDPPPEEPPPATVPNVVGLREGEASAALAGEGLSMSTRRVRVYDRGMDGRVVSQSPGGGAPHPANGVVAVEIGRWCTLIC